MLDPYVEGWAKEAGMETSTLASILGGNIIGGVIEIPIDMFLTEFGAKLASGAIGLAGLLLGTYTFHGQGRLQVDVMQIGSRVIMEILDPSPQQIKEIQRNVGDFFDGLIQGRLDKVLYSVIRNPREMAGLIPGALGPEKKLEDKTVDLAKTPKGNWEQPPNQAGIVERL